jgi:hypothetical protein
MNWGWVDRLIPSEWETLPEGKRASGREQLRQRGLLLPGLCSKDSAHDILPPIFA